MIFSRFLIAKNRRPALRCLYNVVRKDVRSKTGRNIRTILLETKTNDWSVSLLRNLLEVRSNNWGVVYDDDTGEVAEEDDVNFMIAVIDTG